jgi:hypothetical protein
VYAGGSFTGVRPAGAKDDVSESKRYNLMAYNLTTGASTGFAPNINGVVKELALSSDQKVLYVGGKFNLVNNVKRENFAAIDIATGAVTKLSLTVNDSINAITVVGSTIYLGGAFNMVNGTSRSHLAAISASSGALTGWAPSVANGAVQALVATPDKSRIIAGGSFDTLGATTAIGMGSLDATTGALRPWKINTIVKDKGSLSAILALNVDGDTVYGAGYGYGGGAAEGGNFEGVFAADPTTGNVKWLQDCHGDTYDVAPVGNTVYSVGHSHYCANIGGFPDTNPRVGYYRALAVTKQASLHRRCTTGSPTSTPATPPRRPRAPGASGGPTSTSRWWESSPRSTGNCSRDSFGWACPPLPTTRSTKDLSTQTQVWSRRRRSPARR